MSALHTRLPLCVCSQGNQRTMVTADCRVKISVEESYLVNAEGIIHLANDYW